MPDSPSTFERLRQLLGISPTGGGTREPLISALGGFLAILAILLVSESIIPGPPAVLMVASMGASAVLLFAVPHGPLSQPWALVGGHLVSALVGVSCARWIPGIEASAAAAVGIAIGLMYLLRCIHPPGGATALSAVVGGPAVHELGYGYVIEPVLLNVAVILAIALAFNLLFPWRRYPAALARPLSEETGRDQPLLDHQRLISAIEEVGTFVDVNEEDLLRIFDLASRRPEEDRQPLEIEEGRHYSNGRYGGEWQVRRVDDIEYLGDEQRPVVSYRVVAGHRRRINGKCGLAEFGEWAAYEVERNENSWQRS